MAKITWHVVPYRSGGTMKCSWTRTGEVFNSVESAREMAAGIEKMGYRAIVMPYDHLVEHGMPIGWEPKLVDHDRDEIKIVRDKRGAMLVTKWTSHKLRRSEA